MFKIRVPAAVVSNIFSMLELADNIQLAITSSEFHKTSLSPSSSPKEIDLSRMGDESILLEKVATDSKTAVERSSFSRMQPTSIKFGNISCGAHDGMISSHCRTCSAKNDHLSSILTALIPRLSTVSLEHLDLGDIVLPIDFPIQHLYSLKSFQLHKLCPNHSLYYCSKSQQLKSYNALWHNFTQLKTLKLHETSLSELETFPPQLTDLSVSRISIRRGRIGSITDVQWSIIKTLPLQRFNCGDYSSDRVRSQMELVEHRKFIRDFASNLPHLVDLEIGKFVALVENEAEAFEENDLDKWFSWPKFSINESEKLQKLETLHFHGNNPEEMRPILKKHRSELKKLVFNGTFADCWNTLNGKLCCPQLTELSLLNDAPTSGAISATNTQGLIDSLCDVEKLEKLTLTVADDRIHPFSFLNQFTKLHTLHLIYTGTTRLVQADAHWRFAGVQLPSLRELTWSGHPQNYCLRVLISRFPNLVRLNVRTSYAANDSTRLRQSYLDFIDCDRGARPPFTPCRPTDEAKEVNATEKKELKNLVCRCRKTTLAAHKMESKLEILDLQLDTRQVQQVQRGDRYRAYSQTIAACILSAIVALKMPSTSSELLTPDNGSVVDCNAPHLRKIVVTRPLLIGSRSNWFYSNERQVIERETGIQIEVVSR